MARSVILVTRLRVEFVVFFVVSTLSLGKQAKGMNVESGRGGIDDKGPLPNAKRRILKLASHAMKKQVVPPRLIEVR
uniref:Secreted protein n=1 Tax=Solanum lycopersicum TaxID=4081 RepID=A0A3Q7ISY3_SOLLC